MDSISAFIRLAGVYINSMTANPAEQPGTCFTVWCWRIHDRPPTCESIQSAQETDAQAGTAETCKLMGKLYRRLLSLPMRQNAPLARNPQLHSFALAANAVGAFERSGLMFGGGSLF
jgi:hypothetical protein